MNGVSLVQAVLAEIVMTLFWIPLVVGGVLMLADGRYAWITGLAILAPIVLGVGRLLSRIVNGFVAMLLGLADRSVEYRADRFAGDLGFGAGLVGFLERLAGMESMTARGFLIMQQQRHPPTALRIERLEAMQDLQAA
jgi:Zn-dependent protease with chaperone function